MRVKLEIDVDENTFNELAATMVKPYKKVSLHKLMKGRTGVVKRAEKFKESVYGVGHQPIGMQTTGGEIIIVVS